MEYWKRVSILLALLGIVLLAFALMYPTTPGQNLFDSTNYHYMSALVSRDGTARWNLGPLSLYQLYPINAGTMGQVYFLSGLSQATGLHIQPSILVMNIGWMLLICLSSFMLGRKIFKSYIAGLLNSLFYMSGLIILTLTRWTATPRGFAAAILPILFYLMIQSYEFDREIIFRKKFFLMFMALLIITPTIHRLLFLFYPVVLTYFIYVKAFAIVQEKGSSYFAGEWIHHGIRSNILGLIIYPGLIGVALVLTLNFGSTFFGRTAFLTESAVLQGDDLFIKVSNYFYWMFRGVGVAAFFSIIGFISLSKSRKTFFDLFLIIGILSFIPLSIRQAYIRPIWAVFLTLFAAIGFIKLSNFLFRKHRFGKLKIVILVSLLIAPILVPPFVTLGEPYRPDRARESYVTDIEVESGIYLKHYLSDDGSYFVDPTFNAHILTGLTRREGLGLMGVEYATANETMREKLEVEALVEYDGLRNLMNFIEDFYEQKGEMYRLANDPIFEDTKYYRSRHFVWIRRHFLGARYQEIIRAYNIETIIIDEYFVGDYRYISDLESIEYVTYRNPRYTFYIAPKTR